MVDAVPRNGNRTSMNALNDQSLVRLPPALPCVYACKRNNDASITLVYAPVLSKIDKTWKLKMELLNRITDYLADNRLTLTTAESCTAGLILSELARVPGSGQNILCGLGVYSPEAKNRYLGVSFDIMERYGLTSEAVAREMASGALHNSQADVAVANTGIAGPDPGDDGTPAGTICFAWAFQHQGDVRLFCETRHFHGDRNEVRLAAAHYALERLPHYHRKCVEDA